MKKHILILFTILISGASFTCQSQSEFDNDYNSARVENEYKYSVPFEIYDSVWNYMRTNYDTEKFFLKRTNPLYSTSISDEYFIDQYFDNNLYQLLTSKHGVRYRSRKVLSDTMNRKNNRELMQIKLNGIDKNPLNRAEYKFPIKHYSMGDKGYESNQFLGLVKKDSRLDIMKTLSILKVDAYSLRPFIKLDQLRKRVYISKSGKPFATITLDSVSTEHNQTKIRFIEIEMELNEIAYTQANSEQRVTMENINKQIMEDLMKRFPQIKQDQTPKYNKAYNKLKELNEDFDKPFLTTK